MIASLLILWGTFLLFCISTYINILKPEAFGRVLSYHLTQTLPLTQIQFGAARIAFFPTPHIRLYDIKAHHKSNTTNTRFTTTQLELSLRLFSLLQGEVRLSSLNLDTPDLMLTLPNTNNGTNNDTSKQASADIRSIFTPAQLQTYIDIVHGLTLHIENGNIRVQSEDTPDKLTLSGIQGVIQLPGLTAGNIQINSKELIWKNAKNPSIILRDLSWTASKLRFQNILATTQSPNTLSMLNIFASAKTTLGLSLQIAKPKHSINIQTNIELLTNKAHILIMQGTLATQGDIELNKHDRNIHINIPFKGLVNPKELSASTIQINNAQVNIDKDNATINGSVNFTKEPNFIGKATVHHFSLPHWFDFARNLPTDLQHALNNLSGELDIILTKNGIAVPHMKAKSLGTSFQGNGQIKDFAKPDIHLNLTTSNVNLNTFFPVLLSKPTKKLRYATLPIVSEASKQMESDVDFAITISAHKVQGWRFNAQNVTALIKDSPQGVNIAYTLKNFYDGSAKGTFDLSNRMKLQLNLDTVNARDFVTAMMKKHVGGGSVTASIKLDGPKGSVYQWVGGADVEASVQIKDGYRVSKRDGKSEQKPFHTFHGTFQGAGKAREAKDTSTPHMFTGHWQAGVSTDAWQASVSSNGLIPLEIKTLAPVNLKDLPIKIAYSIKNIIAKATSRLTYEPDKQDIKFASIVGTLSPKNKTMASDTTHFTGHINAALIHTDATIWQGQLKANTPKLRETLNAMNNDVLNSFPANAFKKASVATTFTYSNESFTLQNLQGMIDATSFTGNISKKQAKKPQWLATLHLGKLDTSLYKAKKNEKHKKTQKSQPLAILETFDLQSNVFIKHLKANNISFTNVHAEANNTNAVLTVDPIIATAYRGSLRSKLTAKHTAKGDQATLSASLVNLDMLEFSKAKHFKTVITGSASSQTNLTATITTLDELKSTLNGTWQFHINNGYFAKEINDPSLRQFSSISATGTVNKGISRTNNFLISGPKLIVQGGGTINLPQWNLDYTLKASIPGFPNVPIHITGNLDKPETNIDTLTSIASGLGNLGTTLLDSIGIVITSPLRLLEP